VLLDELSRVARGRRRVGGVVEDDELDLAAGDLALVRERRLHALRVRDAERRVRSRQRDVDADLEVGGDGGGGQRERRGGGDERGAAGEVHGVSPGGGREGRRAG